MTVEPEPEAPTRSGRLSTDGIFVTLEIAGRRNHFVIASDALPVLKSITPTGESGSMLLELVLPGEAAVSFEVSPDSVVAAEKTVALLASVSRPKRPQAVKATNVNPAKVGNGQPRTAFSKVALLALGALGVFLVALLVLVLLNRRGDDDAPSTVGEESDQVTPVEGFGATGDTCLDLSSIVSALNSGTLTPDERYWAAIQAADILDRQRWGIVAASIRESANSGFASIVGTSIQGYIDQQC